MDPTKITLKNKGYSLEVNKGELFKSLIKSLGKILIGHLDPVDTISRVVDSISITDKYQKKAFKLIYKSLVNTYMTILASQEVNLIEEDIERALAQNSIDEFVTISKSTFQNILGEPFIHVFQCQFKEFVETTNIILTEDEVQNFSKKFLIELMKEWNREIQYYKGLYDFFFENPFLDNYEKAFGKPVSSFEQDVRNQNDKIPIQEKSNALKKIALNKNERDSQFLLEGVKFFKQIKQKNYEVKYEFYDYGCLDRFNEYVDLEILDKLNSRIENLKAEGTYEKVANIWNGYKRDLEHVNPNHFYNNWLDVNDKKPFFLIYSRRFGKYGFINRKGEEIIFPRFDKAEPIYENRAIVALNGGAIKKNMGIKKFFSKVKTYQLYYGYINEKGQISIPMIFEYAENFRNGIAKVVLEGKEFFINKEGERLEI